MTHSILPEFVSDCTPHRRQFGEEALVLLLPRVAVRPCTFELVFECSCAFICIALSVRVLVVRREVVPLIIPTRWQRLLLLLVDGLRWICRWFLVLLC